MSTKTSAAMVAGLEIRIPERWQPDHVFRFTIPDDSQDMLPGALKVRSGSSRGFRPNLIVCRVPLRENQTFDKLFEAANDAKRGQDRSFEVLRSGAASVQGRRMLWQDAACVAGPNRTKIFQREIGVEESEASVTMFVFTSDKNNLDTLSSPVFGDAVHSSLAPPERKKTLEVQASDLVNPPRRASPQPSSSAPSSASTSVSTGVSSEAVASAPTAVAGDASNRASSSASSREPSRAPSSASAHAPANPSTLVSTLDGGPSAGSAARPVTPSRSMGGRRPVARPR